MGESKKVEVQVDVKMKKECQNIWKNMRKD